MVTGGIGSFEGINVWAIVESSGEGKLSLGGNDDEPFVDGEGGVRIYQANDRLILLGAAVKLLIWLWLGDGDFGRLIIVSKRKSVRGGAYISGMIGGSGREGVLSFNKIGIGGKLTGRVGEEFSG